MFVQPSAGHVPASGENGQLSFYTRQSGYVNDNDERFGHFSSLAALPMSFPICLNA
jgi:hypothetical protein